MAVFNGELFDYPELRESLLQRGHQVRSHSDSELLVHLWEDFGEEMFSRLRGQFAFALLDIPQQRLVLGRDRVGICPLYWARNGDWLVFGSEIKALIASELTPVAPDPKGLDNIFTFFCMPGRRTAFQGISAVPPGHYLRIDFGNADCSPMVQEKTYWDFSFPDKGCEEDPSRPDELITALNETFGQAVRRRLRADVPVASYLSGGVDSSMVVAKCRELSNAPLETFTAQMGDRGLDESQLASRTAADFGCGHHTVECNRQTLVNAFPGAVVAAESPVVDLNAGSLHTLSRAVHQAGYKVVLSGEGADEAFAGYIWFKAHRLIHAVGWRGFQPLVSGIEKLYHRQFPKAPPGEFRRICSSIGGLHAPAMVYLLTSMPRWWLLRDEFLNAMDGETAFDQLEIDTGRIRRWDPLNQSLYMGYKTQLPGLLLNHRGDRAAMANSVEVRYPFLDESVIELACRIHPRWKLSGLHRDKVLLRLVAQRMLPKRVAMRRKAMFRAPFADTLLGEESSYVRQLLSPESINRTPYFSAHKVADVFNRFRRGTYPRPLKMFYEMALCAVVGTQLWHHLFLGGGLCELPAWQPPPLEESRPQASLL